MTLGEVLQVSGVSGAVTAVLFVLADFWKPFFAAYLGKKGERLANAEDIEKILREVKLVTAETEAIKAQFSGGLWERQTLWNKRVEVYAELLASITDYLNACTDAFSAHNLRKADPAQPHCDQLLLEAGEKIKASQKRQQLATASFLLFSGNEVMAKFRDFTGLSDAALTPGGNLAEVFAPIHNAIAELSFAMRREIEFERKV